MTLKSTEKKVGINGRTSEKFALERDLRQGYLLSPILFNFYRSWLSYHKRYKVSMHGQPKIHKEGAPPTQELAKFLAKHFQSYAKEAEEAESYVKNARHFIERITDITLEPGYLLVSFNVVSFFTNIPVDDSMEIIRRKHQPSWNWSNIVEEYLLHLQWAEVQTSRRSTNGITSHSQSIYGTFGDKCHRDDNLEAKIMATLHWRHLYYLDTRRRKDKRIPTQLNGIHR